MFEPLSFYPAPGVAKTQYWIIAAGLLGAVLLFRPLLVPATEARDWLWKGAELAGLVACTVTALLAWRRSQRIAAARANDEPQLVIDPFGVMIRDDFLWRPHRFPWSRIKAIDALPHDRGLSIVVRGKLGPLGRLVDITTDSEDPEWMVADRIAQLRRRPTLH